MQAIFGREGMEAVASGDPVADRYDRQVVALAMEQSWHWEPRGENARELVIGDEKWPFPVPLVKTGDEWQFDFVPGRKEVARQTRCHEDHRPVPRRRHAAEYAANRSPQPAGLFASACGAPPAARMALLAEEPGERPSPMGDLVADAEGVGYAQNKMGSVPFRGYHCRILTAQGPAAPGGQKSYVVNGRMPAASPSWRTRPIAFSGVMTFMVGPEGIVYQKDLGPDTATQALRLAEYNPDGSWTAVQAP